VEDALYYFEDENKLIHTSDLNLDSYIKKYRGNLFCPTENCDAKLVFVLRTSKPSYFRTWKGHNHNKNCLYHFKRIANKAGRKTEEIISVRMGDKQKRNALKEAFRLTQLSEEERKSRKHNNGKRSNAKKKPISNGKENSTQLEISLNNDDAQSLGDSKQRQPRLIKRNIDTLTPRDLGKPRVLTGDIELVIHEGTSIIMYIVKDSKRVSVKFEEAFFANSPNFRGIFHHIEGFIAEKGVGIFVGIGEVKLSTKGDSYDFFIFHGDEFSINGLNLLTIASFYSS